MSSGLFVKLDVGFFDNPKIVEVGEKAAWLYLNMLAYCKQHGSDGVITDAQLARLPVSRRANRVTSLSEARLIERSSTGDGWTIVGWLERNKSAAEIEDIREKRRSAGRQGGRPPKDGQPNGKQTESKLLSHEKPRVQSTELEEEVEKTPCTRSVESDPPSETVDLSRPSPDGDAPGASVTPIAAKHEKAEQLATAIVNRYGDWAQQPPPKVSKEAIRAADLLLRRGPSEWSDNPRPIDPCEIREVIDWIYNEDEFWPAQIQSATALRRHWLKLTAKHAQVRRVNGTAARQGDELQAIADQLKTIEAAR